MSALLTTGRAGPAEAFWGGKPVDAPAVSTFEEQVENISEELSEAATEVLGDSDTDKEVAVVSAVSFNTIVDIVVGIIELVCDQVSDASIYKVGSSACSRWRCHVPPFYQVILEWQHPLLELP